MNRFLKLLFLCLLLTLNAPLQAKTNGVTNEPDSVYLFSYSHADGSGGLDGVRVDALYTGVGVLDDGQEGVEYDHHHGRQGADAQQGDGEAQ